MILDLIKNNASYDTIYGKPSFLEKRGNKTLVRLNIKEVFDESEDTESEKLIGYSCYEVFVVEEPTKDNIKRAIMKDIYPYSETELINNYQAYKMGITTDKNAEKLYVDYLKVLNDLDKMINEVNKER